jgi:hypothetical protein
VILFRYAWIIALLIMLGSCLTSPKRHAEAWPVLQWPRAAWTQGEPTHELDIAWARRGGPPPRVVDGVCIVHMADQQESDLLDAERQVEACVATGGLRLDRPTPPGAVRLRWYRFPDVEATSRAYSELYTGLSRRVAGFYYHGPGEPCHVATARTRRALGHELKHCFDGQFHRSDGSWLR